MEFMRAPSPGMMEFMRDPSSSRWGVVFSESYVFPV
jgi:hypothetical protein